MNIFCFLRLAIVISILCVLKDLWGVHTVQSLPRTPTVTEKCVLTVFVFVFVVFVFVFFVFVLVFLMFGDSSKGLLRGKCFVPPKSADRDWEMCVSCRPHLLGQWRRQDAIRAIRGLTCQETQIPFVSPPANTRTRARRSKTRRISNLDLCAFDKNVINGLNLSFLQKILLQDIICGTTQYSNFMLLWKLQMLWHGACG